MFEPTSVVRRYVRALSVVAALGFGACAAFDCGTCFGAEEQPVVEVVRERFPDGRVRIERDVTVDADGNYVNHGAWRMWDEAGKLIAVGRFEMGRRSGEWTRIWNRGEAALLDQSPFDQYAAPFTSLATFVAGELDGDWTIVDAQDRKCSCVAFRHGKRDGKATLWQADGQVCREATFRNGVAVGDVRERGADARLATVAMYIDGHQLVNKVTNFSGTDRKKSEASFFAATVSEASPDDFWQLRFAEYTARGETIRHGTWKTWYEGGQVESEGVYEFDRENGKFTWWHANGQPAVEGQFVDGQEDGTWVWWHANGQKAAVGSYHYGKLVGSWRGWTEDGRLVRRNEYADGKPLGTTEHATLRVTPTMPVVEITR